MKILILGGTGFIGSALTRLLGQAPHTHITIISRNPSKYEGRLPDGVDAVAGWDNESCEQFCELVEEADAFVNLAGENIGDSRWNRRKKQRIRDSRMRATEATVEAIRRADNKPAVLLQASAVGYYGHTDMEHPVTEEDGPGEGFLAEVARDWEAASEAVEGMGVRRVLARSAAVLGPGGGALASILPQYRLGLGGPLGSGDQPFSWIHLHDEVRAMEFLLNNDEASGPYNLCAPQMVDNETFAKTLGNVLGMPAVVPVPGFTLRLMMGDAADEILLNGQAVRPDRLQEAGFAFDHPQLHEALAHIVSVMDSKDTSG